MTTLDTWEAVVEEIAKGVPCGEKVDALTVTASGAVERARLMAVTQATVAEDGMPGEPIKEWRFRGNKGFQKGSIRHASCPGYSILMITGDASQAAATRLLEGDCKWTRVDLAVDVEMPSKWPTMAQALWRAGEFQVAQEKRGREARLVMGQVGDTLYVGKRTSGRYFRLYDKSDAYGEERGSIWRYEVELKKYHPERIRAWFCGGEDYGRKIRDYVKTGFEQVGIPGFAGVVGEMALPRIALGCSNEETVLQWLRTSVRPPVQRLIQLGLMDSVVSALDLERFIDIKERV